MRRRRKAVDHSVGVLTGRLARAANCIADLGESAESDSVRLRALRSIFSGAIAMSKFAVLKRRMAAIKEELHERTETAGPSCPAVPCSLVDTRFKKPKKAPLCLTFSRVQDAFQGGERAPHLVSPLLYPIWKAPFRRVQSLMAHVHRRAPDNFGRCSLPPSEPWRLWSRREIVWHYGIYGAYGAWALICNAFGVVETRWMRSIPRQPWSTPEQTQRQTGRIPAMESVETNPCERIVRRRPAVANRARGLGNGRRIGN